MASEQEVRQYLAYWFQLGKKVVIRSSHRAILPQPVIQGDRYSQEFEECWQQILLAQDDYYLDGTEQTIAELLTPAWDVEPCSRCWMPLPIRSVGMPPLSCPCHDLSNWPNTEIPAPRSPVSTQAQLMEIRDRLSNASTGGLETRG